jgi:hypothetical protein
MYSMHSDLPLNSGVTFHFDFVHPFTLFLFSEYEKALRSLGPEYLSMINTTLSFKSVIAGKVCLDKSRERDCVRGACLN